MNLNEIGLRTGTDKNSDHHGYLDFYEHYLGHLRDQQFLLIECGHGGYHYPDRGGESARMWLQYFTQARIITTDMYDKVPIQNERYRFYKGSQDDKYFWGALVEREGRPLVFIDDASHVCRFTIATFNCMFGEVLPGGYYIIEDIHTSLWNTNGYDGNPDPYNGNGDADTTISFLHRLQTGLQVDSMQERYREQWDGHIESMHFMRNTCIIQKRR